MLEFNGTSTVTDTTTTRTSVPAQTVHSATGPAFRHEDGGQPDQ